MKVRIACLSMGLALAVTGQPASAADWYNGAESIKDMSGPAGVPVPAPVPVADYATDWYIGVVTGGVLSDESTVDTSQPGFPVRENFAKTMFGGISVGRYLTPSLRAELAFDFYDDFSVSAPGEVNFAYVAPPVESSFTTPAGATTYDTHRYDVTRTDIVKVGRTTGMVNLYYDIPLSQRFKPYIGGGVGVTWRSMRHKYTSDYICDRITNPNDPGLPATGCTRITADRPQNYTETDTAETDRFDIALAAMAGFSFELTPSIIWDNGYQLLWESSSIQQTVHYVGDQDLTVTYGDTIHHQFRTGLRFLID